MNGEQKARFLHETDFPQSNIHKVVALLNQYQEEIVEVWTENSFQLINRSTFRATREEWKSGIQEYLFGICEFLLTGSDTIIKEKVSESSRAWIVEEFDIGELISVVLGSIASAHNVILEADPTIDANLMLELATQMNKCGSYAATIYASKYAAEINRSLSRKQAQMALVLNVLESAGGVLNEKQILHNIAKGIALELGRKHFLCMIAQNEAQELEETPVCVNMPETEHAPDHLIRLRDLINSRLAELRTELDLIDWWYWRDTKNATLSARSELEEAWLRAALLIPLYDQEGLLAVIAIANYDDQLDRPFTQPEINLAHSLAQSANQALHNVDLNRQIRQRAITEERDRLARELHDDQAQILGTINWRLATIDRLLTNDHFDDARASLAELAGIVERGYEDSREAIVMLRIASTLDAEFLNTLRNVVGEYQELHSELGVELVVQNHPMSNISASAQLQVFRILQEALANVWKHAGATRVDIGLWRDGEDMILKIEDDGCGFDPTQLHQQQHGNHFGCSIMVERAESIGGSLEIHSRPGNGTRVLFRLPVTDDCWRD